MKSRSPVARAAATPLRSHTPSTDGSPDYIEVAGFATLELDATSVVFRVRVDCAELDVSADALANVPGLRSLNEALDRAHTGSTRVTEVEARTKSGLLGSAVEGRYVVETESSRDHVAGVLQVIEGTKHADLLSSAWQFPDANELLRESLASAVGDAKSDAQTLATALGIELGSPVCVLPTHASTESSQPPVIGYSSKSGSGDLHLTLSARRTVVTKVVVRFSLA